MSAETKDKYRYFIIPGPQYCIKFWPDGVGIWMHFIDSDINKCNLGHQTVRSLIHFTTNKIHIDTKEVNKEQFKEFIKKIHGKTRVRDSEGNKYIKGD